MRRALAQQLQFTQVRSQPFADGDAELRRTGRQIRIDEGRQLRPRLVHQQHELIQRGAGVLRFMQQEADGTGKQQ
ncbi:hypothetical protein D3C86_1754550 [compost metagenome]